jgi:hypothetical protein
MGVFNEKKIFSDELTAKKSLFMTFPYISNRANQSEAVYRSNQSEAVYRSNQSEAVYRMKQETKRLHFTDRPLWNKNKAKHQRTEE